MLVLGGGPLQLGIVYAVGTLARIAFLIFGGALVDRLPRRTVLISVELASAILVSAIALLGLSGRLEIPHLYGAAGLFGVLNAFSTPAISAIIPELVPEEVIIAGNALRGFSRQFARIRGPLLAGGLIALAGPALAFAFDAATFYFSLGAVFLIRGRLAPTRCRNSMLADVREGWSYTLSIPWLWITIFGFALINAVVFGPILIGLPVLVVDVLRAEPSVYAVIVAAIGVGQVLGGIVTTQIRRWRNGTTMYLYVFLEGLSVALIGFVPRLPAVVLFAVAVGYGIMGFTVLWESALQQHVPGRLLGRVTSIDWFGAALLGPITPILFGILISEFGPTPSSSRVG